MCGGDAGRGDRRTDRSHFAVLPLAAAAACRLPAYRKAPAAHLITVISSIRLVLMRLFTPFSTRSICFCIIYVASALAVAAASSPAAAPISDDTRPWLDGHSTALPLLSKKRVSRDTVRYTFSTNHQNSDQRQSSDVTLGIPICSCLLVSPPGDEPLTRPYTPISSRHVRGQFELLVKHYPDGAMGRYFAGLRKGDCMMFRQIPKNIKELVRRAA